MIAVINSMECVPLVSQQSNELYSFDDQNTNDQHACKHGQRLPKVLEAPLGPVSAIDFGSGPCIYCFEEKTSRIVCIDAESGEKLFFTTPPDIHFENYYWSHLTLINNDIVLALLKHHETQVFYLLSLKLIRTKLICMVVDKFRTKIHAEGYRVCLQICGEKLFYGFCHCERKQLKVLRKSDSDLKLIRDQLVAFQRSESTDSSNMQCESIGARKPHFSSDSNSNGDNCSSSGTSLESEDRTLYIGDIKMESAFLEVSCTDTGTITANVLSVGRERLGVLFRKPSIDLGKEKSSSIFTSAISTKYMSRIPKGLICNPFYHDGLAYFVVREKPSRIFVVEIIDNPEKGLIAAFYARLRSSTKPLSQERTKHVDIDCSYGFPPYKESAWSNPQMFNKNAYFFVQDFSTSLCSFWMLQLEEQFTMKKPKEIDILQQVVEVHSTMYGEDQRHISPLSNNRTVIRIDSSGNIFEKKNGLISNEEKLIPPCSSGSSQIDDTISAFSSSTKFTLRWIKLSELRIPNFKLVENAALRINSVHKFGCIQGFKIDNQNKTKGQSVIVFPLNLD